MNVLVTLSPVFIGLIFLLNPVSYLPAAELPDLGSVPRDLTVPPFTEGPATAGKRTIEKTNGWEHTDVHHSLYLPPDWKPGGRLPVVVEFAGNGNYKNALGDISTGRVEDASLGYGISGGKGMIWVVMPFIEVKADGSQGNAITWWGDIAETKRYCIATVKDVCTRLGGDEKSVVLSGFSRGAIACNYIGLHDDEISRLWCAFVCHSHYDGVHRWSYPESDAASALRRLARLGDRPQFISHEGSTTETEAFLKKSGISGRWTFEPLAYRNHSDQWVLCDLPIRRSLRRWLSAVLGGI